jgi:cytochrome c peroxidase
MIGWVLLAPLLLAAPQLAAEAEEPVELTPTELAAILRHSPLPDPPRDPTNRVELDERAARLGQFLFFDPRMSKDGRTSCSTCHDPARSFGDGSPTPPAFAVQRNTPSLWNAAHQRWYFWDGRADRLWTQALEPMENPREQAGSRLFYAHWVSRDPSLREAYEAIFGPLPGLSDGVRFPPEGGPMPWDPQGPLSLAWTSMRPEDRDLVDEVFANLGKSIAAYERLLVSRRAPFDVFVEGLREKDPVKQASLTSSARRGLKLFVGKGQCSLCHSGPLFSDLEFHDIRLPGPNGEREAGRFAGVERVRLNPFNGGGAWSDDPAAGAERLAYLEPRNELWGQFKTPSLRNVARNAPYMHSGQMKDLREVLRYYSTLAGALPSGHHAETLIIPRGFSESEIADLIAFLETLSDPDPPSELLRAPEMP